MNKRIQLVSLGCPKNDVDSEIVGKILTDCGFSVKTDANGQSSIFINTCGFIEDAKRESIEHIIGAIAQKKAGIVEKIFVAGCLVQRYKKELLNSFPEVDEFFTVCDFSAIKKRFNHICTRQEDFIRYRLTPKHYAYLKIAEGCDYKCSFCAIPMIRGPLRSRTIPSLENEAYYLAESGVKELIIIAEDITRYGSDLGTGDDLCSLLIELEKIPSIRWIRLLYGYPGTISEKLIDIIADSRKICKYLDMPIQHISNTILRKMKRSYTRRTVETVVEKLRKRIPEIVLRTTVIVGFPGESKERFVELSEFLMDVGFDRLGIFMYSDEDGTPATHFDGKVAPEEITERFEELVLNQETISEEKNKRLLGKNIEVLIDLKHKNQYIGRTYGDAPEIDQIVRVNRKACVGEFTTININKVTKTELIGQ